MIINLLSEKLGKKRWSQADLVRETGIRPMTINRLYNDTAMSIKMEHLDCIYKALGCGVADILEYVPDPESKQE